MNKNIVRKYPAKLIYNNGYWYVDCFSLGKIDLGDDIPEQLELMQDIIEKSESATSPTPKESQKAIPSLNPDIKRNKIGGLQCHTI